MTMTATYSPDDNKMRLYASSRLDKETYDRVKAAGFKWAPKQDLFVAPMWTPQREDLLIELCGEIGDEDISLVDRAEDRADRFEVYGEKRLADANAAHKAVAAIADNIPFGQPILVGHHSEKHARRDAEKIESGMRRAVKMWRTSQYWEARAAGALRHAKYKELPAVRARRIKTIEADNRKVEREIAKAEREIKAWQMVASMTDPDKQRAAGLIVANGGGYWSMTFPLADYPRDPPASQYEGPIGIWSAIDGGVITAAQAAARAIPSLERSLPRYARWLEHYNNRLTYERAMLEEAGASSLLDPKPRRELAPLLNYRAPGGSITTDNMYNRGQSITYAQVEMTKAEYARINVDYKGARMSPDKSHRFRTAMVKHSLVAVFLTDSKVHELPNGHADKSAEIADRLAELDAADAAKAAALDAASEETGAPLEQYAGPQTKVACPSCKVSFAIPCAWMPYSCDDCGAPCHEEPDPIAAAIALADEITAPLAADLPAPSPSADFEAMARTLRAGGVQVVSAPQLFPTPAGLAAEMVEIAEIEPSHRVLEPSAGTGALLKAIGDAPDKVAIEINPQLAQLLARCGVSGLSIINADFLDMVGAEPAAKFDRVLMNPPFVNGADIKHIEHARKFLKPGGRLVAICANGPRQQERLRPIATQWRALPPGTFKESGTMVNAALLVIDAPPA